MCGIKCIINVHNGTLHLICTYANAESNVPAPHHLPYNFNFVKNLKIMIIVRCTIIIPTIFWLCQKIEELMMRLTPHHLPYNFNFVKN